MGTVDAVPFVGRAGSLLDLGQVLRGAVGTVASARAVVVARADTPARVLDQLREDGGGKPTTYASVADRFDATPAARADSLSLLVAIGVGLVALTHLLAWLAVQLGRRRAEVAGLRAAGIGPRRTSCLCRRGRAALGDRPGDGRDRRSRHDRAAAQADPAGRRLVAGTPAPPRRTADHPRGRRIGVALFTAMLCALVFTRLGRAARPAALRSADQ